ncbi:MAG: cytochrome c [Thermodesulfobacteriota bacterium]
MSKVIRVVLASFMVLGLITYNGVAEEKGNAAEGKTQYDNICASCHGATGKGDGIASAALDPKPRDLSDASYVSTLSNEHLFKVINEGGAAVGLSPMMAAWGGVLSEPQIWDVIAYIHKDICKCEYKGE